MRLKHFFLPDILSPEESTKRKINVDSPCCAAALFVAPFCFWYHRLNEKKEVGKDIEILAIFHLTFAIIPAI